MNFNDFDKKMRVYEQSIDQHILADMYLVARLDGRSFSRLTKEICDFEAPFDERFRDMMVNTVKQLVPLGRVWEKYSSTSSARMSQACWMEA